MSQVVHCHTSPVQVCCCICISIASIMSCSNNSCINISAYVYKSTILCSTSAVYCMHTMYAVCPWWRPWPKWHSSFLVSKDVYSKCSRSKKYIHLCVPSWLHYWLLQQVFINPNETLRLSHNSQPSWHSGSPLMMSQFLAPPPTAPPTSSTHFLVPAYLVEAGGGSAEAEGARRAGGGWRSGGALAGSPHSCRAGRSSNSWGGAITAVTWSTNAEEYRIGSIKSWLYWFAKLHFMAWQFAVG